jgi:hypothetical protein
MHKMHYRFSTWVADIKVYRQVSDTALVMFPTAWFLGPLRWWVPYVAQVGFAAVAKMLGTDAVDGEVYARGGVEEVQARIEDGLIYGFEIGVGASSAQSRIQRAGSVIILYRFSSVYL